MFKKNLLIIPILIIGYFGYNFIFIGSDEKQIKTVFNEIKKIVKVDGSLKKQQILARTLKLKELIAKDVQIKAFEGETILFETASFDSVQGAAFMGGKYLSEHKAIIQDLSIEVDGLRAQTELVIVADGETIENEPFRELFSANIVLNKVDNKWVIIKIDGERMTNEYN